MAAVPLVTTIVKQILAQHAPDITVMHIYNDRYGNKWRRRHYILDLRMTDELATKLAEELFQALRNNNIAFDETASRVSSGGSIYVYQPLEVLEKDIKTDQVVRMLQTINETIDALRSYDGLTPFVKPVDLPSPIQQQVDALYQSLSNLYKDHIQTRNN